jgi:hypothetical protein
MVKISLFKVGLATMFFFVFASNVLNYVSIASHVWSENSPSNIWYGCNLGGNRDKCFKEIPPALIATGTALNCLSLLLIALAQIAICNQRFRNSFSIYFVIGSWIATLFSLVFNSTGWYFIFVNQYQAIQNLQGGAGLLNFGWSFWLMTPVFASSVIAGLIGASILGCTCVHNKVQRERRDQEQMEKISNAYVASHVSNAIAPPTTSYSTADSNDPQVLRL